MLTGSGAPRAASARAVTAVRVRSRRGGYRRTGGVPGRPQDEQHDDDEHGDAADTQHEPVDPKPGIRLGGTGESRGEDRRHSRGEHDRDHHPDRSDAHRPQGPQGEAFSYAHSERREHGVLGGLERGEPRQELPADQHGNKRRQQRKYLKRDRLRVEGAVDGSGRPPLERRIRIAAAAEPLQPSEERVSCALAAAQSHHEGVPTFAEPPDVGAQRVERG